MGQDFIGSVTEWDAGADLDWAYEIARSFLAVSLGDPPAGVEIDVIYQDHELGSYPSFAVVWDDLVSEPWDYIRRAETALREFHDAIDWSRIRPSDFLACDEGDSAVPG